MNWHLFGIFGYLSVALAAGTVLLWLVQWRKPARVIARTAMLLAVLAYAGARVNSATHVNRIRIDPAEQLTIAKARGEQRRQTALSSRGGEVADIRFAEDAEGEYYDRAGMDEADLKYLEGGSETPEWKKQKRGRGSAEADDDSLESRIGAKEATAGVETDAVTADQRGPVLLMSSGGFAMANRLDRWNLHSTLALMLVGLLVLALDYLRRANIYQEAGPPLRLPGVLRRSLTPLPAEVIRPHPPRRAVPDELVWLLRRGESFVYFAAGRQAADEAMARLGPLAAKSRRADVIRISPDGHDVTDGFVFEALWHGRASFVIDAPGREETVLSCFVRMLGERRATRARAARTYHLVWDREKPIPESLRDPLIPLLRQTGGSLFLLHAASHRPSSPHP